MIPANEIESLQGQSCRQFSESALSRRIFEAGAKRGASSKPLREAHLKVV